jgi:hypothetical protein
MSSSLLSLHFIFHQRLYDKKIIQEIQDNVKSKKISNQQLFNYCSKIISYQYGNHIIPHNIHDDELELDQNYYSQNYYYTTNMLKCIRTKFWTIDDNDNDSTNSQ